MRWRRVFFAAALLLAGCGAIPDKSTTRASSNPAIIVTHLGDYDGCKMYEAGYAATDSFLFYFVRCPHESTDTSWMSGAKVKHHYSVRTVSE